MSLRTAGIAFNANNSQNLRFGGVLTRPGPIRRYWLHIAVHRIAKNTLEPSSPIAPAPAFDRHAMEFPPRSHPRGSKESVYFLGTVPTGGCWIPLEEGPAGMADCLSART
jgi:hypothetical protein